MDISDGPVEGKPGVLILNRTHPPEISGYMAMEAFVETLLEDNQLANAFRQKYFGTWDSEGRFFDTTHFPPSLARYPFKGRGCYLIEGRIVDDFDFPSMEVDKMERLPYVRDERY